MFIGKNQLALLLITKTNVVSCVDYHTLQTGTTVLQENENIRKLYTHSVIKVTDNNNKSWIIYYLISRN